MISDIVLGCSFGDEGKGKVVYSLLTKENYDLCIRFNGSGNAGHTIYVNNKKLVLHQLPIGVLFNNTFNLISSDCLIDLNRLNKEIEDLESHGFYFKDRLYISKACHLITPETIEYDRQNNKIGTTGSGIGPTMSLKMLRTGKRVEDEVEFINNGFKIVDMRRFWFEHSFNKVLLEGAQGFELDINWTNNYPYCTSSTCTLAGAINTGIPLHSIRNIYGINKAYDTYVGTMNFQPEGDDNLERIGIEGKEFGSTTGRKRQCNYLNLDNLLESLYLNQCNKCIINKYDILKKVNVFKIIYENRLVEFTSWEEMREYISSVLNKYEVIYSESPYIVESLFEPSIEL